MIGCKHCTWQCAEYVRNAQGDQRSGYRLLELHYQREHGTLPRHKGRFWAGNPIYGATVDDRCPSCEGKGCEACEPGGVVQRVNFNTLEQIEERAHD